MAGYVEGMKRTLVTVVGVLLILVGLPLLLLPGPGLVVIILGLAVLGVEYAWARRRMREVTRFADRQVAKLRRQH
ncbi:MAG: hypothetical protein DHS20C11_35070 [Lysobacteraceae bacterium]|nr:MAG: hypothetical protein DHS20C11_35070 [Xanthomonadaceae bacterium]